MKRKDRNNIIFFYLIVSIILFFLTASANAQINLLFNSNQYSNYSNFWDTPTYNTNNFNTAFSSNTSSIFSNYGMWNSPTYSYTNYNLWSQPSYSYNNYNLGSWPQFSFSNPFSNFSTPSWFGFSYGNFSNFGFGTTPNWNFNLFNRYPVIPNISQPVNSGMPNPAAVYCINNGGEYEIRNDEMGNQYGVCIFGDGSECEEWDYYRGNCAPGQDYGDIISSKWLTELIEQLENEPVANPPAKIIQYIYNGNIVYYIPEKCCDFFSILYDANGNIICHPGGGFTGQGDGKCPDFYLKRTDEVIIWEDDRTYPPVDNTQSPSQGSLDPKPGDSELRRSTVYVTDTDVLLLESYPVQVKLKVRGSLPTPCNQLRAVVSKPDTQNRILIDLYSLVDPDIMCIQVIEPFDVTLSLGSYTDGTYTVWINNEQVDQFSFSPSNNNTVIDDSDCCSPQLKALGYECIQDCGPPVVRLGDPVSITYSCLSPEEIVNRERYGCPICLAAQTMISTLEGQISVENLEAGMIVWSIDINGKKIAEPVIDVSSTSVPSNHKVVHLILEDGRELWASPNHPTADGREIKELQKGNFYDGSAIKSVVLEAYNGDKTYDLLPAGETGQYWANGILMGSTLK